jgi:predicted acyltransferase
VLHRIAVAYFFAALLFCFFRPRTLAGVCVALLAGYWALMTFVAVPGIGQPDLSQPGKNLAHYIDGLYLPGRRFEGTLLSATAAVANCLLGIFAGLLLKNDNVPDQQKVYWLLGSGAVSLALGLAWAQQFPIIKLLWTSTYVLIACGYSAILLAIFYQVIELWNCRKWTQPFVWLGMNAITVYIVGNIVGFRRLAERFAGGDIKVFFGDYSELVLALITTAFAFWLVYFLYRRKIFLRL